MFALLSHLVSVSPLVVAADQIVAVLAFQASRILLCVNVDASVGAIFLLPLEMASILCFRHFSAGCSATVMTEATLCRFGN